MEKQEFDYNKINLQVADLMDDLALIGMDSLVDSFQKLAKKDSITKEEIDSLQDRLNYVKPLYQHTIARFKISNLSDEQLSKVNSYEKVISQMELIISILSSRISETKSRS